jgi:hypothetical protein
MRFPSATLGSSILRRPSTHVARLVGPVPARRSWSCTPTLNARSSDTRRPPIVAEEDDEDWDEDEDEDEEWDTDDEFYDDDDDDNDKVQAVSQRGNIRQQQAGTEGAKPKLPRTSPPQRQKKKDEWLPPSTSPPSPPSLEAVAHFTCLLACTAVEHKKRQVEMELEALHERMLEGQRIAPDQLSRLAHQRYLTPPHTSG